MIRKLLGFLLSIIVAVCLFFLLIIIVPMNTKTLEKVELTYIFIDDDGNEYNIFDKSHGSAKDWSFLFRPKTGENQTVSGEPVNNLETNENTGDNELLQEDLNEGVLEENLDEEILENTNPEDTGNIVDGEEENINLPDNENLEGNEAALEDNNEEGNTKNSTGGDSIVTKTGDKGNVLGTKDYIGDSTDDENVGTGGLEDTGDVEVMVGDKEIDQVFNLPEGAIEKPTYKDCETPRGIKIKHDESVLAYQQRTDVPDICNVQRRTCNDGVLGGSFTQPACDETANYVYTNRSNNLQREASNTVVYTKKEVIPKNNQNPDVLVQNPQYAKNDKAEFDKNGKIKTGTIDPITSWDENGDEWLVSEYDSVEQINIDYYNCKTPRGELVAHGQFVRAYEFPYGFTNSSCKIELRLCVDGELKGSYKYRDCEYLDSTYEEYYDGELDDGAFVGGEHQITDKKSGGFWNRLKNLFKRK